MSFVVCIFLVILLWGFCAGQKADLAKNGASYRRDFPPCKLQEEYLLICEFYHQYLMEGREDAEGDAYYDARKIIYESGYLPSPLEQVGRSWWPKRQDDMRRPCSYKVGNAVMTADDPPCSIGNTNPPRQGSNALGLARWREEDSYACNLKSCEHISDKKWEQYCNEMNDRYERLVIQSLVDWDVVFPEKVDGKWLDITKVQLLPENDWMYGLDLCQSWVDYHHYEEIIEKHKDELLTYRANKATRKIQTQ